MATWNVALPEKYHFTLFYMKNLLCAEREVVCDERDRYFTN